jgi:hypothetical protein
MAHYPFWAGYGRSIATYTHISAPVIHRVAAECETKRTELDCDGR